MKYLWRWLAWLSMVVALAACGGGGSPPGLALSVQPSDTAAEVGSTAAFSVTASGTAVSYQWQVSADDGATWGDLAGALAASYTTAALTDADNGKRYRVVVNSGGARVVSSAAMLTVTAAPQAPVITTDPTAQAVTSPNPATFTAAANGVPTPTLQWQFSTDGGTTFVNIAGAVGPSYTTPATVAGDTGKRYRTVASNSAGTVNSAAATLSVLATAPLTFSPLTLPGSAPGAPYAATLSASGGTPPYHWISLSTPPGNLSIDASTGVISGTAPAQTALYRWMVQVQDSASPPQSSEDFVDLNVEAPCDNGFGSLTVDGAPPTVGGRLCPQQVVPPGEANSYGVVNAAWLESNPGVFEGVGVEFEFGSGRLVSVTYHLNDPTRLLSYSCSVPAAEPYYPLCTGVTLDPVAGTVTFKDTEVRSGTVQPFKLNGMLRY